MERARGGVGCSQPKVTGTCSAHSSQPWCRVGCGVSWRTNVSTLPCVVQDGTSPVSVFPFLKGPGLRVCAGEALQKAVSKCTLGSRYLDRKLLAQWRNSGRDGATVLCTQYGVGMIASANDGSAQPQSHPRFVLVEAGGQGLSCAGVVQRRAPG
jgi:hypothetical protein